MKGDEQTLLDVVNRSGFPFQIAVARLIGSIQTEHNWSVLHIEHEWHSDDRKETGFIDLVVQSRDKSLVLVIECKRADSEKPWVFFNSELRGEPRRHAKLYFNRADPRVMADGHWGDGLMDPTQAEALFCVRQEKDNGRNWLLERDAATLVSATEALGREEAELARELQISMRIYTSILVTTAKLIVCEGDPNDIALLDGKLAKAKMYEKDCIRFRKQLSARTIDRPASSYDRFEALGYEKEHTVLVVNIDGLGDLLAELQLAPYP